MTNSHNLLKIPSQKALETWFTPWGKTHHSWQVHLPKHLQKIHTFSKPIQSLLYGQWCQHIGISTTWQTYRLEWVERYFGDLNDDQLMRGIEMLGLMLQKHAKHHLDAASLRWCHQISLARPIIAMDLQSLAKCKRAFDFGLNVLAQWMFCHAKAFWTRFLLRLDKNKVAQSYLHPYPIFKAGMFIIIEKHWLKILKRLTEENV